MSQNLEELTHALLLGAKKAGANDADAMAVKGTALSIDVRNGVLEQAERSEGVDIGLRVFVGQRQACVSSSDTSQSTIDAMCERAIAMAKENAVTKGRTTDECINVRRLMVHLANAVSHLKKKLFQNTRC